MEDSKLQIVQNSFRRARLYITLSDSTEWSRKIDPATQQPTSKWTQLETASAAEPEPLQLHVVEEWQSEGEPKHWFLHAVRTDANGATHGPVWQVTDDAEMMHYEHFEDVDRFHSTSYAWHQIIHTHLGDSELAQVDSLAQNEPTPWAPTRKDVWENCQGWTVRLLQRLVATGIADQKTVAGLEPLMDPL